MRGCYVVPIIKTIRFAFRRARFLRSSRCLGDCETVIRASAGGGDAEQIDVLSVFLVRVSGLSGLGSRFWYIPLRVKKF
jgi:hypothetical protein